MYSICEQLFSSSASRVLRESGTTIGTLLPSNKGPCQPDKSTMMSLLRPAKRQKNAQTILETMVSDFDSNMSSFTIKVENGDGSGRKAYFIRDLNERFAMEGRMLGHLQRYIWLKVE